MLRPRRRRAFGDSSMAARAEVRASRTAARCTCDCAFSSGPAELDGRNASPDSGAGSSCRPAGSAGSCAIGRVNGSAQTGLNRSGLLIIFSYQLHRFLRLDGLFRSGILPSNKRPSAGLKARSVAMSKLKGTKTQQNLKDAFAGESQANRRYLYFAKVADVEGFNDVAAVFRSTAEGETGHAHGHLEYLEETGDPATGEPIGNTSLNLKASVAGETHEYTDQNPGMAKTAR